MKSPSNNTIAFMVEFDNRNKDKGIHFDNVNFTFGIFLDRNRTVVIGNATIDSFYQGHSKKAKKLWSIEARGGWENVLPGGFQDSSEVFRFSYVSLYKYELMLIQKYTSIFFFISLLCVLSCCHNSNMVLEQDDLGLENSSGSSSNHSKVTISPMGSEAPKFTLQSFPQPLATKLDDLNFLIWRLQVVTMVWERIETQTQARERQLFTQFRATKKGNLGMSKYLLKLKKIVYALASIKSPVSERDHIQTIFDGLPSEYETFITSLSLKSKRFLVSQVEAHLLAQEARLEKSKADSTESISANVAQTQARNPSQGQRNQKNFQNNGNLRAETLRQTHIQNQNASTSSTANSSTSVEALMATPETLYDASWYPDSGASSHLTNDVSNIHNHQPYSGSEVVHTANGTDNYRPSIPIDSKTPSSNIVELWHKRLVKFNEVVFPFKLPQNKSKNGAMTTNTLPINTLPVIPIVSKSLPDNTPSHSSHSDSHSPFASHEQNTASSSLPLVENDAKADLDQTGSHTPPREPSSDSSIPNGVSSPLPLEPVIPPSLNNIHSMTKYIQDLLTKFELLNSKPQNTPMVAGLKLSHQGIYAQSIDDTSSSSEKGPSLP
ncbi:Retrovirus-related Pol polyprotein from transposon TNT 1-94 [Senna tora]|uniref:Retrovirus-related Pol polyprotein from transposon TNT 1-94 n=1 Tax=Senna tora TaxID=362788 RepID=A0A834SXN1_9FABA|nr:Retrovirus-related Pol polyprotein from transposon TNT 1-94 [Senna tora]